jgi:predicted small secreted protein
MNKQKILLSLSAIILMSLSVTACETMEGAGRDIEDGGEAIQRAAD